MGDFKGMRHVPKLKGLGSGTDRGKPPFCTPMRIGMKEHQPVIRSIGQGAESRKTRHRDASNISIDLRKHRIYRLPETIME